MLKEENALFSSYKYQNIAYKHPNTGERIILLTTDSWFMTIPDKLKMRCMQELAHVKYIPSLNLKTTEEVQEDYNALKKKIKNQEDVDAYYINIVEEISTTLFSYLTLIIDDFNEWCISENNVWGIPIPFFIYKDTNQVLMDDEIIEHVAEIYEKRGSDAWYTLPVIELLPKRYHSEVDMLVKGKQVFDVWFNNSLSWNFVLNEEDYHENNPVTLEVSKKIQELNQSTSSQPQLEDPVKKPAKLSMKDYLAKKKQKKQQLPEPA